MADLLASTDRGLWCEAGGFFVDPWRPRAGDRAVITHGHSDHARLGADDYLTSKTGVAVVRGRLGPTASVSGVAFGERVRLGDVVVSLHPAGHVLGSCMVRIERGGEVWVVSGDYKTERDCCGEIIDPQRCDVLITESTFGLPVFRWHPRADVASELLGWWRTNADVGVTSVVYAYALGKAQSVLAMAADANIGPVLAHGAVRRFVEVYRAAGVRLPEVGAATRSAVGEAKGRALVVAPPSAAHGPWCRGLGESAEAMASGWMLIRGRRRRRAIERGFVLSDHADWDGLLGVIASTGARRVLVTHGYSGPLSRWLRERGTDAQPLQASFRGEEGDDTPTGGDSVEGDTLAESDANEGAGP